MSVITRLASTTLAVATAATLIAGAAAPAYAADAKPNKTVEMPAAWLTKPGTKFCLSRGLIAREKRGNLPGTVCQTRDEWSAVGVDIVARK
jgi:hypothetical protein